MLNGSQDFPPHSRSVGCFEDAVACLAMGAGIALISLERTWCALPAQKNYKTFPCSFFLYLHLLVCLVRIMQRNLLGALVEPARSWDLLQLPKSCLGLFSAHMSSTRGAEAVPALWSLVIAHGKLKKWHIIALDGEYI